MIKTTNKINVKLTRKKNKRYKMMEYSRPILLEIFFDGLLLVLLNMSPSFSGAPKIMD